MKKLIFTPLYFSFIQLGLISIILILLTGSCIRDKTEVSEITTSDTIFPSLSRPVVRDRWEGVGGWASSSNEHLVMSVLWYQKSAEMRALYYQAYNIARLMLNKYIAELDSSAKKAIIIDIDETLLNNSPFEAKLIETGEPYTPETWKQWTDLVNAEALPGAVEFLNYAASKNVEVFYISNRKINELKSTMINLNKHNFPYVDKNHIFLKTDEICKKKRREKVAKDYEILLLIGDNLMDFSEIFENRSDDFGFGIVDKHKEKFGNRFIILPNPMYGAWEKGLKRKKEKYPPLEEKIMTNDNDQ